MKHPVTISIVDDDCDLTEKIAAYLNKSNHYRFLSSYTSAEEALAHLPRDRPDVVLDGHQPRRHEWCIECVRQFATFTAKNAGGHAHDL